MYLPRDLEVERRRFEVLVDAGCFSLPAPPKKMSYSVTGFDPRLFGHKALGLSLSEVVKPVVGLRIDTSSIPIRFQNIIKPTAGDEISTPSPRTFVFMLTAGEHVLQVLYTVQANCLLGVRFQTNLRFSQWFRGSHTEVPAKAISAGYYQAIHSLCSSPNVLGAVLWPNSAECGTSAILAEAKSYTYEEQFVFSVNSNERSFGTDVKGLAAIVVTMPSHVSALTVLSREEYERYVEMIDVINLGPTDHVVELLTEEQMLEVECTFDQYGLHAIRFVTTCRVTPWLGSRDGSSLTSKAVCAPPGAHISGLFGRGTTQLITEIGVVVACPLELSEGCKVEQESIIESASG